MALSDDQRAMLQLLLERDQSYEDIASLLGLEVEEVRARARGALTEIGGADPDREVGLTDYLLGQADPIGRADAARQLQSDPESRDLAQRLAAQLQVLAPGARLPDLPGGRTRRRADVAPAGTGATAAQRPAGAEAGAKPGAIERLRSSASGMATGLSGRQRKLIAGLAAAGLLILAVVLIATGAFGGGDDGEGGGDRLAADGGGNPNASGLTRAQLTPRGGSDAQGVAVFARLRNSVVLQVNVANLEPTGPGEAYVVWLYRNDRLAFPLSVQPLKRSTLRGIAPVPLQVQQALSQGLFDSIDISLTRNSELQAANRVARRRQQLPRYAGRSVARGPIVGPGVSATGGEGGGRGGGG